MPEGDTILAIAGLLRPVLVEEPIDVRLDDDFAADPRLIVGDEPTGNLDTITASEMFELLRRLNGDGKTVLFVTHDRELAARAQRIVEIRDGVVVGG